MPLARGIRVLGVHIFCSPGGLASQPLLKKANHRDEADDAESQEGYHDDGRPPHVDHLNLTIYLTFPEQKAAHRVVDHTWSNEVACRPLTQLGHLAANCSGAVSLIVDHNDIRLQPIKRVTREARSPGERR